jgi:subtilisin family serine protease
MCAAIQFDPALKQLLLRRSGSLLGERLSEEDALAEIPVVAKLRDPTAVVDSLRVVARFGPVVTGRVPLGKVVEVRRHPNMLSLKASRNNAAEPAAQLDGEGAPGPAAEPERPPDPLGASGRGVVVAVAGWGLDFAHVNFRHPDGSTRLLCFWDQRGGLHPSSPEPFGYGREFTSEQINRALRSVRPHELLAYDPADADPRGIGAHDTHVMDIAAGNGSASSSCPGMAPAADLAFVHLKGDDTGPQDTLGDSVRLLEAIRYLVDRAGRRPLVCNLSLGRTGGPHDASPLVVQALDALLAEHRGLVVSMSTGNYFQADLHSTGVVRQGEQAELHWQVAPSNNEIAEMEIWYPGADVFAMELLDPTGLSLGRVPLGEDQVVRDEDHIIASIYHRHHDPNNGDNQIDVFLWPDAALGIWTAKLEGVVVSDGRYHAWIERDDPTFQSRFVAGSASPFSSTGTIVNGYRTIGVGAYDGRNPSTPMGPFSSAGPTRDLRLKPDVSAPGVGIWAARSSRPGPAGRDMNGLTLKSGTSMAAPWVAGVIARMLEVAGPDLLTADEVRRLLVTTARRNPPSDDLESLRYGAGRVDPVAAVASVRARRTSRLMNEADELLVGERMSAALPSLLVRLGDGELRRADAEGVPVYDRRQPPIFMPTGRVASPISGHDTDHTTSFVFNSAYLLGYQIPVHPQGASVDAADGYEDAAVLFEALAGWGGEQARAYFARFLDVIAMPGDADMPSLRRGDLLLCGGEPSWPDGRLAVVADPLLRDLEDPFFRERDAPAGRGLLCIEAGEAIHTLADRFGRVVLDVTGRVPDSRMVVRLRASAIDLPRAQRQLDHDAYRRVLEEAFPELRSEPLLSQLGKPAAAAEVLVETDPLTGGRAYAPMSDPAASGIHAHL